MYDFENSTLNVFMKHNRGKHGKLNEVMDNVEEILNFSSLPQKYTATFVFVYKLIILPRADVKYARFHVLVITD